jgi:hypothetical protein
MVRGSMGDQELRERTFVFGCRIVRLCRFPSQNSGVSRQIAGQLLRAGTSIGASLEGARRA